MAVQDDRRETEICRILRLRPGATRSGVDAYFEFVSDRIRYATPLELKSTTIGSVSTARDVGPSHIEKWRSRVWIFGFYDLRGLTLEKLLMLSPEDMEPWIGRIERYIAPDLAIGKRVARRLTIEDLHIICGEKTAYDLDDAKSLYKRQWRRDRYTVEMDLANGYSPGRMLEILRLRAEYLNARGATLNNPHIPKRYFVDFEGRMVHLGTDVDGRSASLIRTGIRSVTVTNSRLSEIARNYALRLGGSEMR